MLLNIADKKIGEGKPTFIIAEIGSNHDGSLKQAERLIDEAKKAGADCVKFQSFKAAEYLTDGHPAYDKIRKLEVPDKWHYILADYCRKKKILFASTPFYLGAVDILDEIGVPFYKVASGDLTFFPLLKYVAKKKKPILLSTGMAYLREVKKAVNTIRGCKNRNIALLHCVSNYPPQLNNINLNCLETLKGQFGLPVGLSDHTRSLAVAIGAVAKGACIIERHFTLSRKLKGPDHPFAMEPHEFRDMVKAIKELEAAKGSFSKRPAKSEIPERFFARRKKIKIADKIRYLRPYKQNTGRNNKQVYAVIQARMGSARLPGKVLMDLCGKPMLWHIVERLKRCGELTGIAIATSTSREDDKIAEFAKRNRIKAVRGSKEDVLKRYIDAGESLKADYIVRVCGDCPLIEPHEIDRLIKTVKTHSADFIIAYPGIPSIHEGFSVVSLIALKKAYSAPDIKDYHKEHVTIYLKEHPDSVKTVRFKPEKVFQKAGYRISVDNMADLRFMREIYKRFWNKKGIVDLKQVVKYLEDNPEIKSINAHVTQKAKNENSRKIAFIIEGGEKLGFGHFVRTTRIAGYLVENKNCGVIFITNSPVLCRKIKELGFKPFYIKQADLVKGDSEKICRIIKKENPECVVIDVKNNHDPSDIIRSLRKTSQDRQIALIDNATKARLLADKNIYPGIDTGIKDINWKNYKGDIYTGIEFFPLRDEFVHTKTANKNGDCVVVTMGAADANNVTPFIMKALINTGKKVRVIIGPAFKHRREIKTTASRYKNIFELYENPDNYAQIIASSSLAVTALGISIYEISYLGVPIMVIGNYESDSKAGKILEQRGYCKYIGCYKNVTQDDVRLHAANLRAVKGKTPVKAGKNGTKNISEVILS